MASKKAKERTLAFVETEGGPFILLPLEHKKSWNGAGDGDYDKAEKLVASIGVLPVGTGQALILGTAEVTAYWQLDDGGVFIQRVFGDEDHDVIAAVEKALPEAKWKKTTVTFDPGKGKLALFDSAYSYEDADEDERLRVTISPGKYAIETCNVKAKGVEVSLVRLRAT